MAEVKLFPEDGSYGVSICYSPFPTTPPAQLLARAGPLLFGRHWRADFCHTFSLNERRLRRMLAGGEDVPEGLLRDVEIALRDHGTSLDGLLAEFP